MVRETRNTRYGSVATDEPGSVLEKGGVPQRRPVWTVGYRARAFRLKDAKGLGCLVLLGVGQYADSLARGLERIGAPL